MWAIIKHPLSIAAIVMLIFAGDILTGPYIQFPVTFILPIGLMTWYHGGVKGIVLAIFMVVARFAVVWQLESELVAGQLWIAALNALIRGFVLVVLAWLLNRVALQLQELNRRVRVLEGILPICSFCKKIRSESGAWQPIESYITQHSEAEFSHGLCVPCARHHYAEFMDPAGANGQVQ